MKIIFVFYICCISFSLFAQKHDYIWHLGYEGSFAPAFVLDFNFPNDSMYVISRQIEIGMDNSSFCDENGKMFCYTNGVVIHDSAHQLMLNGDSLNPGLFTGGNKPYTGYPTTEGTMFLPVPNNDTIIKLFHLGSIYNSTFLERLYVTTINTKGNNGKGEVISKNEILIQDTMTCELEAVKHANGRDWWIIVPRVSSNGYFRVLLTSDSIYPPIYQPIGHTYALAVFGGQGTFSPDGTKYARYSTYNGLDIFDFDRCSGLLSNYMHDSPPVQSVISPHVTYIPSGGGICFSPNSRYLYISTPAKIYQYDVTSNNVLSSLDTVAVYDGFYLLNSPISVSAFSMALLAPNEKIYITTTTGIPFMHIIHSPNLGGQACNIEQRGLELLSNSPSFVPNFPHYRTGPLLGSPCDTIPPDSPVEDLTVKLYPNPAGAEINIEWHYPSKINASTILVFNAIGQRIKEIRLDGGYQGLTMVDVSDLAAGVYVFYGMIGEDCFSEKVVIVR